MTNKVVGAYIKKRQINQTIQKEWTTINPTFTEYAKVFKALSDEKRLMLLRCLLLKGEQCSYELAEELNFPQSSLSYHMKILCGSGIVSRREDGKWTYFSVSTEGRNNAQRILKHFYDFATQHYGYPSR